MDREGNDTIWNKLFDEVFWAVLEWSQSFRMNFAWDPEDEPSNYVLLWQVRKYTLNAIITNEFEPADTLSRSLTRQEGYIEVDAINRF